MLLLFSSFGRRRSFCRDVVAKSRSMGTHTGDMGGTGRPDERPTICG